MDYSGQDRAPETRLQTGENRSLAVDPWKMTQAIARGDDQAFKEFYDAYFLRIYRYLLVLNSGKEDLVADALQDCMIRIVRHMKPFQDSGALWNWIRSLAKSAFIDQVRKRNRSRAELPLVSELKEREDGDTELKEQLRACLKDLKPQEKRMIEGKYFLGKTYEELAKEERVTPKAIESRLARIRAKMRQRMLESLND